ncbi:hypothetical protein ABT352_06925 [Streptosporangium sp. NPDC000563]|uniref:hypothetical protein n=1 Tax=Streptosporangium sp. NPDC000563 TaxID=3154366 RepID=UPI00331A18DB
MRAMPPLLLPEPISGIDEAYIYGSWAARYANQAGPPPRDIDALAVGSADELHDAVRAAERILGREVNIGRISSATWTDDSLNPSGFSR